jgi:hypothetical protein
MSDEKELTAEAAEESRKLPAPETYPNVQLSNSTLYTVVFTVKYALCRTDTPTVASMKSAAPISRGVCLITVVSAIVHTPGGNTPAVAYTSSGTSYSDFACILAGGRYVVTRVVTG